MSAAAVHVQLATRVVGGQLRMPDVRAPELEKLLVHASVPAAALDWRRDAFAVIGDPGAAPPVAAAALHASPEGALAGPWVCIAGPVHLVAGMTDVSLPDDGVLRLQPAESAALAIDFNGVFGGSGARLSVGRNAVLLCVFDRVLDVTTHDPLEVIGGDVFGLQPVGADAARLRRLMSEMELWLFEHAVNRARGAQGRTVITGLWLWGGGETVAALPPVHGWTAGTDPLFAAFGDAPKFPRGSAIRSGVLVCDAVPGSLGWPEVEQRWLEPLAAALRAGEIERLTVSMGGRAVRILKGGGWRFWRRPRPWWESFALAGDESNGLQ
jgi:hypothetical protein